MIDRLIANFYKLPILFLPWLLTLGFSDPVSIFFIAWFGSLFILFLSMSGILIPLPTDRKWTNQIFRPIFLTQGLFIGFTCITPIFYFADHMGFIFMNWFPDRVTSPDELIYLAECQSLYLLGHTGYALALLLFSNYSPKPKWKLNIQSQSKLLLLLAFVLIVIAFIFSFFQGFDQFTVKFAILGYVSSIFCLGLAINEKNRQMIFISSLIVTISLISSFFSGSKEDSIVIMIILGLILFPVFKLKIVFPGLILIVLWFSYVPVYTNTMREYSWYGGYDKLEASKIAVEEISNLTSEQFQEQNWAFFTGRFSEVSMFEIFRRNTPEVIDFYGFSILNNAAVALIPRPLWPGKPNTELVAMERVYEAGIVERETNVSAKTHYFVDAYLSFGAPGVFVFLFIFGALTASASVFSENLFGGYYWGSAIMFTGLFRILWTATSFEFAFNAIFYSFLLVYIFHFIGRLSGFIIRNEE